MTQSKITNQVYRRAGIALSQTAITAAIFFSLNGCAQKGSMPSDQVSASTDSLTESQVLALMETRCFTCHNPDLEAETRLAPPMFMVRNHYYYDGLAEEKFVKQVVHFVQKPSERKSKMPGARRHFGLMPAQLVPEPELKAIAAYIYQNDLGSDDWYVRWEAFRAKAHAPSGQSPLERAIHIAGVAKQELSGNLMKAMQEKGATGAVEYCNLHAIPITERVAKDNNATVYRVSDKPRNPANLASPFEQEVISNFADAARDKRSLSPLMNEDGDKVRVFFPLQTTENCLPCHGKQEQDILPGTRETLKTLYPQDKATGYGIGEIRGLMVVEMNK